MKKYAMGIGLLYIYKKNTHNLCNIYISPKKLEKTLRINIKLLDTIC